MKLFRRLAPFSSDLEPRPRRAARLALALALALAGAAVPPAHAGSPRDCRDWSPEELRRNPTEAELRCRWGIAGPGRFGLLSYADVPVYQPATPMPGTHLVGMPGHAGPREGESYEEWEWRVLRSIYPGAARRVHSSLELLDPFVAGRVMALEAKLREEGIRFVRRETWRSPERQGYLFQQGRSRPGPLATATLTSWHSQVDERGVPAGRAVDYDVPAAQLERFHSIARSLGLSGFGADSNDPGHVFLPDTDRRLQMDIALLRLLPRVPEVTLATGAPVDRPLPPGGVEELRARTWEFFAGPFIPFPPPRIARTAPSLRLVPAVSDPAGDGS